VFTGPFGLRDATDVCGGDELPAEAVTAGLSLLAERSVLLADRPAGNEARFCSRSRCVHTAARCCAGWARTRSTPHGISNGRTTAGRTRAARRGSERYDVAAQPGISKRTVDAHIEHIYGKLGVSSRVQLAPRYVRRCGFASSRISAPLMGGADIRNPCHCPTE